MIFRYAYTHFIGWLSLLVYQLGMKKRFPLLYLCGKHMVNHTIDRLPKSYRTSWLGPMRVFRIGMDTLFKKRVPWRKASDEPIAIYNGNLDALTLRSDYLHLLCGERAGIAFSKDMLSSDMPFLMRILAAVHMFFSALFLSLFMPFSRHRENLAVLPLSLIETSHLMHLVKRFQIKKVHFFCIYLSDANLCAWLLQRYGVKVNKIPSEVPLGFLNQEIISDSLALCFRYQDDEMKAFASGMHVKEVLHWVPETVFLNAHLYVGKTFPHPGPTVGYYSSAMWLRVALGHMDFKDNAEVAEEKLCEALREYFLTRQDAKLQIYLHPLEKIDAATLRRTQEYYGRIFSGVPFVFVNETRPTGNCFHECNLAVSVYSTVIFERIFFGFKSVLFPVGLIDFPLPQSAFSRICATDKARLFEIIDRNLPLSDEAFFEQNGLPLYTWRDYPRFAQAFLPPAGSPSR